MPAVEFVSIQQQAFGFIAIGQEAQGVIAIGQIATGFIAVGQMATGFIAVGQVARGVFALGMASIGLFPVGMVAAGVFWARAMLGLSALPGKALIWPLMPFPRVQPFDTKPPDVLLAGRAPGFVVAQLTMGTDRTPRLLGKDGRELPARVQTELLDAARTRASENERYVVAHLVPESGGQWLADRLIALPSAAVVGGTRAVAIAIHLLVFAGLCAAFHMLVSLPLIELALTLYHAA